METRIEVLPEKTLLGKSMRMSLAQNRTSELWKSFMIDKAKIAHPTGMPLYSIQVYDTIHYFEAFNPDTEFTKWAAIEVVDSINIPNGFSSFVLKSGLYAVFLHKGAPAEFPKTFQYILGQWLPQSKFELDDRAHFEVLGEQYKNNDPGSEEEVWIPIRKKSPCKSIRETVHLKS